MMEDKYLETNNPEAAKKYRIWIILLSIAIPVVVAILFVVKIPNATPLTFLPRIYAGINGVTAIVLVWAVMAARKRNLRLHEVLMKIAIALSLLFLVMYIAYHMTSSPTKYGAEDYTKYIYFFILLTHILLSIAVIPLVLISFVRAFSRQFTQHRKIAKITFPIWLYVAVTGVIVYLMISPYYNF